MDIKKNNEENEVVDNKCVVQLYSREMEHRKQKEETVVRKVTVVVQVCYAENPS